MTKRKQRRLCRICGKPEKKYAFGYSNLTPYSEICTECISGKTHWTLCPKCGYTNHAVSDGYLFCGRCQGQNYKTDRYGKPFYGGSKKSK